jgi:SAM-dependent methyltransferase
VNSPEYRYIGSELDVFAKASVWKGYLYGQIRPFLQGRVAEVGAGLGATTAVLGSDLQTRWLAIEPDSSLANEIKRSSQVEVFIGTLADLPVNRSFEAILYVDVLEHIENDAAELKLASERLSAGGHLVVLGPAHNFLFTAFDSMIGHYRRYNKTTLTNAAPSCLRLKRLRYLDSFGLLASLANKLCLRQSVPTTSQILFWDRVLVRISRVMDLLFNYRIGKSILAVWEKVE